MRGVNQHTVIGTLGRDPELRTLESGQTVTTFSLAVNEVWKDKNSGEQKESTEWINCVCWGKGGEIIEQYAKKGHPLYVQGRSRTRKWEDNKHPGVTRYSTELMVDSFQLLGTKGGGQAAADRGREEQHEASAPAGRSGAPQTDFEDSIPF